MLLVQELTKRAEDMGINWGLEVINRYESNVCNTGLRVNPTASAANLAPTPALIVRVHACQCHLQRKHAQLHIIAFVVSNFPPDQHDTKPQMLKVLCCGSGVCN